MPSMRGPTAGTLAVALRGPSEGYEIRAVAGFSGSYAGYNPVDRFDCGWDFEGSKVDYTGGVFDILDVAGLEARPCECYRVIMDYLDNYAEFDDEMKAA